MAMHGGMLKCISGWQLFPHHSVYNFLERNYSGLPKGRHGFYYQQGKKSLGFYLSIWNQYWINVFNKLSGI